jgi:hypothetical protein
MFQDELQLAVLSPDEKLLGYLHPRYVDVEENNELRGLRSITITHPLMDDKNEDLTRYNDLLVHGNKIWQEKTSDGDSCLYVMLEDKTVDPLTNKVSIKAEEVATELSMLPPVDFNPITSDLFESGNLDIDKWHINDPATGNIVKTDEGIKLSVPANVDGQWTAHSPLLKTALPSGDFDVFVYMDDSQSPKDHISGIVLYSDRNNAYGFGHHKDSSQDLIHAWKTISGKYFDLGSATTTNTAFYLRIKRVGSIYSFYYSTNWQTNSDGTITITWTKLMYKTSLGFTPSYIGLNLKTFGSLPAAYVTFQNFHLQHGSDLDVEWIRDILNTSVTETDGKLKITLPSGAADNAFDFSAKKIPVCGLKLPEGNFDAILKLKEISAIASDTGAGLVLLEDIEGRDKAVAYGVTRQDSQGDSSTTYKIRYSDQGSGIWNDPDATTSNATGGYYVRIQRTDDAYSFSYGSTVNNLTVTRTVTFSRSDFDPKFVAIYADHWNIIGSSPAFTTEFEEITLLDSSKTTLQITSDLINEICGDLFEIGTITTGQNVDYNGLIGVLAFLREVESQTSYEFQFRYEYDANMDKIRRYIDFLEQRGKIHINPIEIGYNTDNIELEDTETDTFLGAGPTGAPSDDTATNIAKFHKARQAFIDLGVDPTVQIPLWVTTDSSGNETLGPMAYPPYAKKKGETFVRCLNSDSAASYKEVQKMQGGGAKSAKICLFSSTEENKYNLYWDCVDTIKQKCQPDIKLDAKVMDVLKIQGKTPEYYNVGDTVSLQLPGRYDRVQARVTKTKKNPRELSKDEITIGNYSIDFFAGYVNAYYPAGKPYL